MVCKQMAQDATCVNKLDILTFIKHFDYYFSFALKCGEWAHLFATNVAKEKILLDIAGVDKRIRCVNIFRIVNVICKF